MEQQEANIQKETAEREQKDRKADGKSQSSAKSYTHCRKKQQKNPKDKQGAQREVIGRP